MESHSRSVSLCEYAFFKVVEKGPSNHINSPAELREDPICLKKEKRLPCVVLTVSPDLNLVVWSLLISHLVGGNARSKLWQPLSYAASFMCCFVLLGAPRKNMLSN